MRRLAKWFILVIILPMAVLCAGFLAVFKIIPQEKLRQMAAEALGRRLHRQVAIGPIQLGLNGLGAASLRLSEKPSFQAGTFVTARGISLGWDLRSIWEGLNIRKRFITRSSGRFHIDEFYNPHYSARDFSLAWSLSDMDPTWTHLSGHARLRQGQGLLVNIDQLAAANPSAKLALTPVTILLNLERSGVLNLGLPDLRRWRIQGIEGEYRFTNGLMRIERFAIMSPQLGMDASGTVELAGGNLSVDVRLKAPPRMAGGPLDIQMHVSGTTAHPKIDLQSLKKMAFKATLSKLLENPNAGKDVNDALKKLFH